MAALVSFFLWPITVVASPEPEELAPIHVSPSESDSAAAETAPSTSAEAEGYVWEGLAAFEQADYPLALQAFQRAYTLESSPDVLFNIARVYGRLGECVEGRATLEEYIARVPEPPAAYFEGVQDFEADCPVEKHVGRASSTPSAPEIRELNPPHAAQRRVSPAVVQPAVLGAPAHSASNPALADGETSGPRTLDTVAYGLFALGGVSAVASVAYGVGALESKRGLEELSRELAAGSTRTWDEAADPLLERLERQKTLAFTFGITAVLLESAGLLLFSTPWEKTDTAASLRRSLKSVRVAGNADLVWCGYGGEL